MIFSSEFLTLELNEKNKTTNSSILEVFLSRKNNNYYNREGIEIYVSEYEDGKYINQTLNAIWYTEYNPYSIAVVEDVKNVIANSYRFEKQFQIGNINLISGKRIGSRRIRVELIDFKNKQTILIGELELNTLEIPLPRTTLFTATNEGKNIKLQFKGINPKEDYRIKITASYLIDPIVNLLPLESFEVMLPILEPLYRQKVFFEAEWYLEDILIEKQKITFRVPSFDLGIFLKTPEGYNKIKAMYIRKNGSIIKIEKVYQKIGGEFVSQE